MKLNEQAMESFKGGSIGKVPGFTDMFEKLAEIISLKDADDSEFTLAWNKEESDLIPEIIVRVRKPKDPE